MEKIGNYRRVLVFSAFDIFPVKYGDQDAVSSLLRSLEGNYELFQPDGTSSDSMDIRELSHFHLKSRILSVLLYNLGVVVQVLKARRRKKNLILITTRFHLNFSAALLSIVFNIKWVSIMLDSFIAYDREYYIKSGNSFHLPFRILNFIEKLAYKKSDYVLISSTYEIEVLHKKIGKMAREKLKRTPLSTKMIECNPEGFAKERNSIISKLNTGSDACFISFHGNFQENMPSLNAAKFIVENLAQTLYNLNDKICILLIGKGLEHYDFSSHKNVRYLGFVENLCEYLSYSCLEIAPISGGQGIKMKILDAMALGKAVIATVDGARGFVDPNPIIVENIENFASRINRLINDQNKLIELGKDSRDYVRKYYSDTSEFKTLLESLNYRD